jgi:hypothetical protein
MAFAFPGVEEGTSYGTPALKVKGRLLVRLKEDGETLVVRVGIDERDMLIEADPDAFFVTEHYRAYPSVLARLSKVRPATLRRLIGQAWRDMAPKRLVRDFDTGRAG